MKPETFFDNFELLTEASFGSQKLRYLFLNLAFRGQLSSQFRYDRRPSDNQLSSRIREKEETPFKIPNNWQWALLKDVVEILDNKRIPVNKDERLKRIAGKSVDQLYPYYGATQQVGWIDDYIFDDELVLLGEDGAPYFDPYKPKAYIIKGKSWVNNHAHVLRGVDVLNGFLCHYLNICEYKDIVSGTTRLKLNQSKMKEIPVPVPSLEEQEFIVAKVDQFMALCDELEARQKKKRESRVRLNESALDKLLTACEPAEFNEHWQRICYNFHLLYGNLENVAKLRQAILQLAVQGKLVPQDPNDEPAAVLLKKIKAEKERLIKEGKIKKAKPLPPIADDGLTYELPPGWQWVRLGEITICRDGERIPLSKDVRNNRKGPYDYYGASGVIDKIDDFIFDKPLLLIGEDGANLINRSTSIAFIAEGKYWVNNHAHVLDSISLGCILYLEVFINAINLKPYITGTAQPKMNQTKMNIIPISLPSEKEQLRIVAKVDQLMALCDELEAKIKLSQTASENLMESVVHNLLVA